MRSVLIVRDRETEEIARVVLALGTERDIKVKCVRPDECGEAAKHADLVLLEYADETNVCQCQRRISALKRPVIALISRREWCRWSQLAQAADDFLQLPASESDLLARVCFLIDRWKAAEGARVSQVLETALALDALIGDSQAFARIKAVLPTIAACHASVLVTGETGTGKELVARNLHYLGPRAAGPFLAVNCGAIPLEIFESELFGHTRGAFTGAVRDRLGYLAQANGGTLFLDEIDAMPSSAQVKLLRALQTCTYRPVGGERLETTDVRIVAATNTNLREMVDLGRFRGDLYYRVNVIQVHLPPLRERSSDIAGLATHFLRRFAREYGTAVRRLAPDALAALSDARWPGNVRELENVIHRVVVLSNDDPISSASLSGVEPEATSGSSPLTFSCAKRMAVKHFECSYLVRLLENHGGNITHAALEAGTDRRVLGRLIKRYHLENATRMARLGGTK